MNAKFSHNPPRLVPERPLPPYGYVPGRFPHPIRDAQGHSVGTAAREDPVPDPRDWQSSLAFCRGIDLFNHGYYWEAHEEWEGLWKACGRTGVAADFLKGLIKLAAAGVKVREGNDAGVRRHARRATALFEQIAHDAPSEGNVLFGLNLGDMIRFARAVADDPPAGTQDAEIPAVEVVFDVTLVPRRVGARRTR